MIFEFLKRKKQEKNESPINAEKNPEGEGVQQENQSREDALKKRISEIWDTRKKAVEEILEKGKKEDGSVRVDNLEVSPEEIKSIRNTISDENREIFLEDIEKSSASQKGADGRIKDLEAAEAQLGEISKELTDSNLIKEQLKESILEKRSHDNIRNAKEDLKNELNGFIEELSKKRSAVFEKGEIDKAVILMDVHRDLLYIRDIIGFIPEGQGAESAGEKEQKILAVKESMEKSMGSIEEVINAIVGSGTKEEGEAEKKESDEIIKSLKEKIKEIG